MGPTADIEPRRVGCEKDFFDDLTGITFLERIGCFGNECAEAAAQGLPNVGTKRRQCYEVLGMALALMDC